MDRIIGKHSKYLHTAVLLPIAEIGGVREILFERRSSDIAYGDEVCFPGGAIEQGIDASPEQAAIREACEELGLSPDNIAVKGYLGTLITNAGAAIDAFVGELKIDSWSEIRPNAAEVQSVFHVPLSWFTAHEPEVYHVRVEVQPYERDGGGQIETLLPAAELGLPERYRQPWGGRKLPVYVYRTEQGLVWGITAEILREYMRHSASGSIGMSWTPAHEG